ncbi:Ig-like domain-containing protein, partial [Candidatus Bipolaricaulota bacterium]
MLACAADSRRMRTDSSVRLAALGLLLIALFAGGVSVFSAPQYPDCNWNCTANDVTVVEAFVDAPDTCIPGQALSATIYALFDNGTNTNRYAVRVIGDVYIDGLYDQTFDVCVEDTMPPGTSTVPLIPVSWTCGQTVEARIVTVSWASSPETCGDTPKCASRGAKCWFTPSIVIGGTPLAVDFTSSSPECDGTPISFTDQTSGGDTPYTYSWDFGDGGTSSSANPSHLYAAPGTYTVILTVTEDGGVTSSASYAVDVNPNPVAAATTGGPYCPGDTIELFASGGTTYSWTGPNGFSSSSQDPTIPSASSLHAGTYTVMVIDTSGCSDQASIVIDLDTTPPVLTTPPDAAVECSDSTDPAQTGQATASDADDPTPTVTYSDLVDLSGCGNTGTITRTWTATDDCGNTSSDIQTITIVDTTTPSFSDVAGALDVAIECDASTDPAATGAPTVSDGCDLAPTLTYADVADLSGCGGTTGTITRTWTATDDCGNSAEYVQVLTIADTTPPSLSISNATFQCDGAGNINDIANWIASASGSDNCGAVVITNDYSGLTETCPGTGTAAVTFTATDPCGNTTQRAATVSVADTAPPNADDDDATIDEDGSILLAVLANDSDVCDDTPALISVGTPTFGTATVVGDQVNYIPPADFHGTATFSYTIEDCSGNTDTALVEVTVLPVNDPPVANDQSATAEEDTPLPITVTASDPDGDVLTYSILTGPSNGTISGFDPATGGLVYTPDENYHGPDSFTFEACDPSGACDTGTVTITVEPVDDPPVADPQDLTTPEDTPLPITVTGSDADVGDPITYGVVSGPSNGTISGFDPDTGELLYTPDADFTGTDTFVFETCDPHTWHGCAQATVTITVTPVNDPPIANDDATSTLEDTPVVIGVPGNDSDVDGNIDATAVSITSPPANGTVNVNPVTGAVTYTPNANYNGTDTFTYQICDTDGLCDTATGTVTVISEGDPPVALDDSAITSEDQQVLIDILDNDSDVDNDLDPTSVTITVLPVNGTVTVDPISGEVTYTPDENFNGQDVFTYQVCDSEGVCDEAAVTVTVQPVNDPPVSNDQSVAAEEDTPLPITVTASDPDGDILTYSILTGPSNGTISGFDPATGGLVYTPDENYHGPDSFTFEACDPSGACDTGVVTITVEPVDDPPVADPQDLTTPEDTPLPITVTGSDADVGDPITYGVVSGPSNGTITGFDSATGDLLYTPDADFTGTDSFVFETCDPHTWHGCAQATVTITVTPVNDPPVAQDQSRTTSEDTETGFFSLLVSDPDNTLAEIVCDCQVPPSHGTVVRGPDHTVNYIPDPDFSGVDTFIYEVCDPSGLCDTAAVTVTVNPVADPPVAEDDAVEVAEDGTVDINVPANDSDPDGNLDLTSVDVVS